MPLLRLPRRAQRLFATPVEADGQGGKYYFLAVKRDLPLPARFKQTSRLPG